MKHCAHLKLLLLFLPLLVLSTWMLVWYAQQKLDSPSATPVADTLNKIQFVGDVMLGRYVEKLSREHGVGYPYARIQSVDEETFLVGNFEASIAKTHVPTPSGTFAFSVDKVFLKGLRDFGFDSMSLANNHTYDHGAENFENTVETLTAEGISVFGDQKNQDKSTIVYTKVNGKVVALVGMYAVYTRPSDFEIESALSKAEESSDIQIVSVHWGEEYVLIHNSFQEELAKAFIDAGADAVIGHHPHVVQDIGLYKNMPIFYSLGNFIFDQYFSVDVQEGLSVIMTPKNNTLTFELIAVSSVGHRSQPALMESPESTVFQRKLAERSDPQLSPMIEKGILEFKNK